MLQVSYRIEDNLKINKEMERVKVQLSLALKMIMGCSGDVMTNKNHVINICCETIEWVLLEECRVTIALNGTNIKEEEVEALKRVWKSI